MKEEQNLTTKQKLDVQDMVNKEVEKVNWMLGAVVIVLLMGFGTMFATVWGLVLDATRFKAETYQNLVNSIMEENIKINILTNDVNNLSLSVTNQRSSSLSSTTK